MAKAINNYNNSKISINAEQELCGEDTLAEAERYQLLVEWNKTQSNYPIDKCIHQLFEEQVERTPEAVAVEFEGEQLTYRELNTKANQLAHYLQSLGVKSEVLVGICIERSLEMIVGLLGILKAGGAYVPLDPAYPGERLAFMLQDASVPVLLTETQQLGKLPQHLARVVCLDSDCSEIACLSEENPTSEVAPNNLAYVIYTSGSTGKPKGVLLVHRGLCNLATAQIQLFNVQPDSRILQFASLSFDASVSEIFMALVAGATLVLAKRDSLMPGQALVELMRKKNITTVTLPSSVLAVMPSDKLPALRTIIVAGEVCPANLMAHWGSDRQFFNAYGPTEATVCATVALCNDATQKLPIGRPIANTQTYILDEKLQPVPINVSGELYIGGACLARGYLNRPELTAQKFIPNPFSHEPGSRLYKTGDLARYLPDGNIEFLGRIDHQVKIRGFRIELGEIEAVLRQHPAVQSTVVVLREDLPHQKQLVAYVVCHRDYEEKVTQKLIPDIRRFLQERLPDYMVPSAFVLLDALPLTPNGKVARLTLPAPDTTRPDLEENFVAPRTQIEKVLAEVWSEALGLEQIGIYDKFLELGGHSLLAIQIINRLREILNVELPVSSLFLSPTIAEQAKRIEAGNVESFTVAIGQKERELGKQVFVNTLPTITADPKGQHEPFPLTDIQQAYWIGRSKVFELGSVATHFYAEIESIDLDLEQFSKAWQQLIDRHEMLRAIVRPDGQQQILEQVPPYKIQVLDLRGQDSQTINSQMEAVRESLSHQVIPSDRWPLFEICASILDNRRVRLHFSFDALIMDAWSFQILGRELAKLYQNPNETFCDIEISFRDYVLAELACCHTKEYQRSVDYWQSRIPTLPPTPDLPLIKNPAAIEKPRFTRRTRQLDPKTWQQLKNKAIKTESTPSGILLAALAEILTVWSKSPRFTIGLPLFNRLPLHSQINDIVGDFTSLILLAVDNSAQDSFAVRARRLQAQLWDDLDHRYFSGVQVLQELHRQQGRGSAALMPVVFTSTLTQDAFGEQNFPLHWLGETVFRITQTSQVFLDVQVSEEADVLVFNWDAVEELFPAGMLDDMFVSYGNFLQRLAEQEENWQQANPQLLPPEQLQQRATVNATSAPVSAEMLHTLFAARVPLHSQKVAVVATHRTLTYEELYWRSNQLGYRLQKLGARPNTLVAVVMEKGWEQVVACLGILMSGAAYVPIDPALPKERQSLLLAQAEVEIAVTQSWIDATTDWPKDLRRICADTEELTGEFHQPLESVQTPEDLAYVIYTSGSTGLPKGVMIDHRGAVNTIADINQRFQVEAVDRVLALSSLSFDLSVYDIFGTLAVGGTIVVPEASVAQDPAHWAELMVRENISIWNSVPALMQMIVEYAADKPEVFRHLRLVLLSGDWLPLTLPTQIKSLVEGVQVVSLGGATEASIWSILYPIEKVSPDWKSIPYGKPMKSQRFYILDEALEPRPVWVPGQLYIGGIGLARGYSQDEERTAASFITHPVTGERLYKTGDLGRYLPDGNIEYLGRIDHQVKIRGFRIELGEIEAVLAHHPDVLQAVVVAQENIPDNKYLVAYIVSVLIPEQLPYVSSCQLELDGNLYKLCTKDICSSDVGLVGVPTIAEGDFVRLHLLLAGENEARWLSGTVAWSNSQQARIKFQLTPAEQVLIEQSIGYLMEAQELWQALQRAVTINLRNYLKQKLPDYMVPSAFILMKALPLTPNGKVDRRALKALNNWDRELDDTFIAPTTPTEEILAAIWIEVLGMQQVGVNDNFFELGAHSLLATQIISRIRSAFSIELPLRSLFEAPTITSLVRVIEAAQKEGLQDQSERSTKFDPLPPLVSVARDTHIPLSFAQQTVWDLQQLHIDSSAYNCAIALCFNGLLRKEALEKSINEIIRRHQILRTTFAVIKEQPVQIIVPFLTLPLNIIDLQHLPQQKREVEAVRLTNQEALHYFDLASGPLIKTTLLCLAPQKHWLLITMHHIIIDGWSYNILLQELGTLYEAFSNGELSPLPEVTIQYADFTVWQQKYFNEETLEKQRCYWLQKLANIPPKLDLLPTFPTKPNSNNKRVGFYSIVLPYNQVDSIAALSRSQGVTIFAIILAALKILLYKLSGQTDIIILATTANRSTPEIEKMLGCFINDVFLRDKIDSSQTWFTFLKQVNQTIYEALAHQEIPEIMLRNIGELKFIRTINVSMAPPISWSSRILECEVASISLEHDLWDEQTFPLELYIHSQIENFKIIEIISYYSKNLFTDESIKCFFMCYQEILTQFVQHPEKLLSEFVLNPDSQFE
ncbi:MAG: amino acid adenylation domain-containing protein [Nostoc sp.]|uniref:amino acid adenylation domain-containing protein n=1 Tax=Nostoc sp. TaxID=1180 RepID=UPI002FFBFEA4